MGQGRRRRRRGRKHVMWERCARTKRHPSALLPWRLLGRSLLLSLLLLLRRRPRHADQATPPS
jgi:hypothetical protein